MSFQSHIRCPEVRIRWRRTSIISMLDDFCDEGDTDLFSDYDPEGPILGPIQDDTDAGHRKPLKGAVISRANADLSDKDGVNEDGGVTISIKNITNFNQVVVSISFCCILVQAKKSQNLVLSVGFARSESPRAI